MAHLYSVDWLFPVGLCFIERLTLSRTLTLQEDRTASEIKNNELTRLNQGRNITVPSILNVPYLEPEIIMQPK